MLLLGRIIVDIAFILPLVFLIISVLKEER